MSGRFGRACDQAASASALAARTAAMGAYREVGLRTASPFRLFVTPHLAADVRASSDSGPVRQTKMYDDTRLRDLAPQCQCFPGCLDVASGVLMHRHGLTYEEA